MIQWCTNSTNGTVRPSLENPVKYLSSQLYDGLQGKSFYDKCSYLTNLQNAPEP